MSDGASGAKDREGARAARIAETLRQVEEMKEEHRREDEALAGRANRRFLTMVSDVGGRWPDVKWVNQPVSPPSCRGPSLYSSLGGGRGWDCCPMNAEPTPRFSTRAKDATRLADLCYFNDPAWFLGSARFADAMRGLQPGHVAVLPVEVSVRGGVVLPPGSHAMVDVTLTLPAINAEASGFERRAGPNGPYYVRPMREGPPPGILLREDLPGNVHLFRDEVERTTFFVSLVAKDALRQAGITRLRFCWPDRPSTDVP